MLFEEYVVFAGLLQLEVGKVGTANAHART